MYFALSFLIFFYLAMVLSVQGYVLEYPYFFMNFCFFSLTAFTLSILPGPSWLYLSLCYVILWIPTVVVASYIHIYKSFFNFNALYFLWGTNTAETTEFLREVLRRWPALPAWVCLYTFVPLCFLWGATKAARAVRDVAIKYRWSIFVVAAVCTVLFVFYSEVFRFNYATNFYSTFVQYHSDKNRVIAISNSNKTRVYGEGIEASETPDVKENYIVIIGESASRHHWQAYGYPRATTPLAEKYLSKNEAFCFNNVNSTAIGTTESLLSALTFMDQNASWADYSYSIVDMFNGAGFSTYWFSNNAVLGVHDTILQVLSRNAAIRKFADPKDVDMQAMQMKISLNKEDSLTYDDVLMPWLDEALSGKAPKKAIFLHLKGSHVMYQYRYPVSFDHFTTAEGIRSPYAKSNPESVETINYYDNSIRYTDFIIDAVIERLKAERGRAWVLYFSDHGEDVYDLNDASGRDLAKVNKYMLDVPFFVWFSVEYRQNRDLGRLGTWLDRPYRLDDTIHSIIDLAGLKTRFFDPSRSIFSPSYLMRARGCLGKLYLAFPPRDLVNQYTVEQEKELNRQFLQGKGEL